MRLRLALAVLLLMAAAAPAAAHPGVGIVVDRQGNVYYTDLAHVWRITPGGRKSIAVRDVHTHVLAIDADGTLYGEDERYLGGDRWRHRIWRRTADGHVSDVVPWREGVVQGYGFVRDSAGATYWPDCPERVCTIRRRAPNGRVTTLGPRVPFATRINWLAPAPGGALFVVDGDALEVLHPDGTVRTLVRSMGGGPMGMWPDGRGGVYVAVYGRRAVVHVDAAGRVATVARTPAPWAPSGVVRAENGDLLILEYSTSNEARVRRVTARGRVTVY